MSNDNALIAKAFLRYKELAIRECFDPVNLESRPTPKQWEVLADINTVQHRYVTSGNQSGKCLVTGTWVHTPNGAVRIEDLNPGDFVYSEFGIPIRVRAVQYQGKQEVFPIQRGKKQVEVATLKHRWLDTSGKEIYTETLLNKKISVAIEQRFFKAPMGPVEMPTAYALGALLGDGCSAEAGRDIVISSEDSIIPTKVQSLLPNTTLIKESEFNYNWTIRSTLVEGRFAKEVNLPHYKAWCKGRRAHEKTVDIDVLRTWNRKSLIEFVAGLIDTDGSLYTSESNPLVLNFTTQNIWIKDAIEWCLLSLWQVPVTWSVDTRDKYVNGSCYSFKITHITDIRRIYEDLNDSLVCERKRWKKEYDSITPYTLRNSVVANKKRIADTWDIEVESETHLFVLSSGLVSHNSQLAARECAWIFTETHPFWKRPDHWGKEPLQLLVVGRTSKQVEEVLWRKVAAFLDIEELRVQRIGGVIQKVVHRKTGNTIIFASHHNEREAREKLQAFTANWCWVDELPGSVRLVEELHRRVQAKRGYFLATFTPKSPNPEIKKLIDNSKEPYAKKYQFAMFDNPIYGEEDKVRILDSLKTYPDSYRRTVLYGDWAVADLNVYQFERDKMIEDPQYYSNAWRHVAAVDPALQSKFGFTLWAENPNSGVWYLIKAEYISGVYSPEEIFEQCEGKLRGYNLVRRISDPHESWFINTASSKGISYIFPFNKTQRKGELIKNLQAALSEGKIRIASWCTDFIEEIESCQWSETTADKIVNSRSFHLLDSAQYFIDCRPKDHTAPPPPKPWHQELREGNQKRKKEEALAKKLRVSTRGSRWLHSSSSGSRRLR